MAEELHFGRAAERLNVSPSALSEHVATLERRFGRTLFVRTSRSVNLSHDGAALLPLAQRAVRAVDDVVIWAHSGMDRPRIRVGISVFSPAFRAIFAAAHHEMPEIDWQVTQLGLVDPFRALRDGETDCALIPVSGAPPPRIIATPLWTDACVLIVAEDHPLAARDEVQIADLLDQTFVTVGDNATSDRWLGAALVDAPRTLPIAHNFDEVIELCAAGIGVNIAGASGALLYQRPGVRFIPISDLDERPTYLCIARGRSTAMLRQFTELAVRVAGSSGFAE